MQSHAVGVRQAIISTAYVQSRAVSRRAATARPDQAEVRWTSAEMMSVAAARALPDGATCLVGIGLPSTAANLARRLHAPRLILVYESGTLGSKPGYLPLSIGDGVLAETADSVVGLVEMFNYWLQPGRIDVGFLGAAQVDRFANINTTVIGDSYDAPKVRLPGAGGAPEIAAACREVVIVMRQTRDKLVERLDFVTSMGFGSGTGDRERLRLTGGGPSRLITDLGIFEPDPGTCELVLTHLHPGVTLARVKGATGWDLRSSPSLERTPPPTDEELAVLRSLEQTRPGS
jgi:glutaconate CoA-transferase subunit B